MLNWLIFGISIQDILNYILLFGIIILAVFLFIKFPISRWFICGAFVLALAVSSVFSGYKLNEYYSASGGIFGKIEELINPNKVNISSTQTNITFDFSQVMLTENGDSVYSAEFSSESVLKLDSNSHYKVFVNDEPCKIVDYTNNSLVAKYNYAFYGIDGKQILTDELTFTFCFNKFSTDLIVSTTGSVEAVSLWNSYFDKNEFSVNISTTNDIYISDSNTASLTIMSNNEVLNKVVVPCGSEFSLPTLEDTETMRFIGYSLDGTTILDNTTITVNFSQIVYAVYEELNFIRYCYSFDDYKDMNSNIYKVVGYITGENLGSLAPENPTKSNYSFMGWSTDGTTILDLSTIVNDGTISYLYAVWEASSYDIQVSLDGGIMTLNDTSYSEDFTISARFDEIISLSEPSKSLYAFDFWRVYVEHKDGTIGLLCDNSNFNTTIHELIDEHNSSYNVQFGDISFIETVYSISIVAIYVPNTDNPELLSDAELIKYVADSNLCLVYLEYPTTCEEMVRSMYLNIGFGDYETASLFDIMTILNTGYQFNAEITEETTARDFLEIAYIYIWETENQ